MSSCYRIARRANANSLLRCFRRLLARYRTRPPASPASKAGKKLAAAVRADVDARAEVLFKHLHIALTDRCSPGAGAIRIIDVSATDTGRYRITDLHSANYTLIQFLRAVFVIYAIEVFWTFSAIAEVDFFCKVRRIAASRRHQYQRERNPYLPQVSDHWKLPDKANPPKRGDRASDSPVFCS